MHCLDNSICDIPPSHVAQAVSCKAAIGRYACKISTKLEIQLVAKSI